MDALRKQVYADEKKKGNFQEIADSARANLKAQLDMLDSGKSQ